MPEIERLPIKVVPAFDTDFVRPDYGGGNNKVFQDVTPELRDTLVQQVIEVRDTFTASFREFPQVPAVAKVKVRTDAIAKTHRPTHIFKSDTCPIIGAEGMGQLLVSVTPTGIENLARTIKRDITRVGVANISALESIEAYTPEILLPNDAQSDEISTAKIKLFIHHIKNHDLAVREAFWGLLRRSSSVEAEEIRYGFGLKVYRLRTNDKDLMMLLGRFVGIQSIGVFPTYFPVTMASTAVRGVTDQDFPPPDPGIDYPVVGVVDSGTSPADRHIAPWVVGRETYVPAALQVNDHGTFVSGLIANSRLLNHGIRDFPSCNASILDIVAIDPTGTTEDELIITLRDALQKHPEVKVWNLSFGTDTPCRDHAFSDFAVALDQLQDEFGVMFINAAGNYRRRPFRGWPPEELYGADRICAPADSVRSLVVGSIAHLDHNTSRVRRAQPSPFTRKGPGPLYLPKPELCHIGGNCTAAGAYSQIGVLSLDGKGNIAEDAGTSFAAPLVASLAANIQHRVEGGTSRALTRALLIHSAALRTDQRDQEYIPYRGFGVPGDIDEILGCEPWQATLIFECDLAQNTIFQKVDFPMPACLYVDEDTVVADLAMTLAYDSPLDASFGSEYCRSNVDVSLGTYLEKDGVSHQKMQVLPLDPFVEGRTYEKDLVAHGYKWSSTKVFRRRMVSGVRGDRWRLMMSLHHRSGYLPTTTQSVALVLTISDPKKRAPVYNDTITQMNQLGWAAVDLRVRPRTRVVAGS